MIFVKNLIYVLTPVLVESNIKEIKKANDTLLKVIDYVKKNVINLNNFREIYDRSKL